MDEFKAVRPVFALGCRRLLCRVCWLWGLYSKECRVIVWGVQDMLVKVRGLDCADQG